MPPGGCGIRDGNDTHPRLWHPVHPPLGPQTVAPQLAPRSQVPGSVPVTAVCPLAAGTRRRLARPQTRNSPHAQARGCDPPAGSRKFQVLRPFSSANQRRGKPRPRPAPCPSPVPGAQARFCGPSPAGEAGSARACSPRSSSWREDAFGATLPSWAGLSSPGQGRRWAARLTQVQDPSRAEGRVISVNWK